MHKKSAYSQINDLVDTFGFMQQCYLRVFPPGEVADRATILSVKVIKLLKSRDDFDRMTLSIQEANAKSIWCQLIYYLPSTEKKTAQDLYQKLLLVNKKQWAYEDEVRSSGTAALKARKNNSKRVKIKNEINALFGALPELKCYEGE